jgi:hypothetical protein
MRLAADVWSRSYQDDALLHPAVQAVMITCEDQGTVERC